MSNINGRQNFVDNDNDDEDLSLEETSYESATIDPTNSSTYLSISLDQATAVGQSVRDERSNHVDQITNDLIVYLSRSLLMQTSAGESEIPIGAARSWIDESMFADLFDADRAERSNNQIAHTSDAFETILMNLLSPVVIRLIFNLISNNIPLGVQDTHAHTMVLPVVNISDRDVNIDNENGDTNEDATVYNDDGLMNPTTNEAGDVNQMTVIESMATETSDDMTNNLDPIMSNDAQDGNCTDNNNRNDRITEDPESENQNNLNIDHSQTSPRPGLTINDDSHENAQTNIPTTSIYTPSTGSSEQAAEIISTLAGPGDNTSTAENSAHLLATGFDVSQLTMPDRKQSSPFNVPEEVGESKHVS